MTMRGSVSLVGVRLQVSLMTVSMLLLLTISQTTLAEEKDATKIAPSASKESWVNISEEFFKRIGADAEAFPTYRRSCLGLMVTPIGDIVILAASQGVCVSRDQGANWSVVENNKLKGRCNDGFSFSLAYPYDGRMMFVCYDGAGGISLDGAKTWRPFAQSIRGLEIADVDWGDPDPKTLFGWLHEPYFTVLSVDGGRSWRQLYKDAETGKKPVFDSIGVIDGKTLIRQHVRPRDGGIQQKGGIELSTDAGQTWNRVADYTVRGFRPVHYGKNTYLLTTAGVVVTTDGKDWRLCGEGAESAIYGPYFGENELEFVVVTPKSFLKTDDGGKTWKKLASFFAPPGGFNPSNWRFCYFGWDPRHKLLYAAALGASVYRLQVGDGEPAESHANGQPATQAR